MLRAHPPKMPEPNASQSLTIIAHDAQHQPSRRNIVLPRECVEAPSRRKKNDLALAEIDN